MDMDNFEQRLSALEAGQAGANRASIIAAGAASYTPASSCGSSRRSWIGVDLQEAGEPPLTDEENSSLEQADPERQRVIDFAVSTFADAGSNASRAAWVDAALTEFGQPKLTSAEKSTLREEEEDV